jgi:protein PhnA
VPLIAAGDSSDDVSDKPTVDSNGAVLANGDAVCIIKDLNVKGTTFTAKRGTIVRSIRLTSNPEHVEGRVNGTVIVLKTCFLKKST